MPTKDEMTYYYNQVINNPTATPDAKSEARKFLGVPDSSLQGTLPTGTGTVAERTLPTAGFDKMSTFRTLLQTVSARAAKEASYKGVSLAGVDPTKVSGNTMSGVLGFLDRQSTQPISDIYKTTSDLLDKQAQEAQDQLKMLISTGGILKLSDAALSKLANSSGIDLEQIKAIRAAQVKDVSSPKSFQTITRNGQQVRIGFDSAGNIVSETPLTEGTSSQYDSARTFINDNPSASFEELSNGIRQHTDLSDKEIESVLKEKGKVEGGSFLTKDWFVSTYGEDSLIQQAKSAGYGRLFQSGKTEAENYLNDLMAGIEARRKIGMSDKQILDEMNK